MVAVAVCGRVSLTWEGVGMGRDAYRLPGLAGEKLDELVGVGQEGVLEFQEFLLPLREAGVAVFLESFLGRFDCVVDVGLGSNRHGPELITGARVDSMVLV
jgi:hypothetical protein